MKNKKLNLTDLKVRSFVTDVEEPQEVTIKGGGISRVGCITKPFICNLTVWNCPQPTVRECIHTTL